MGAGALGDGDRRLQQRQFRPRRPRLPRRRSFIGGHTNGRPIGTARCRRARRAGARNGRKRPRSGTCAAVNIDTHGTSYAHRNNYLDLDPTYRDAWGRPLVRMTFDFPENDLRMSRYVTERPPRSPRQWAPPIVSANARRGTLRHRALTSRRTTPAARSWAPIPRPASVNRICRLGRAQLFVMRRQRLPAELRLQPHRSRRCARVKACGRPGEVPGAAKRNGMRLLLGFYPSAGRQ